MKAEAKATDAERRAEESPGLRAFGFLTYQELGLGVEGSGFRVRGLGVEGSGFRVLGSRGLGVNLQPLDMRRVSRQCRSRTELPNPESSGWGGTEC